LAAGVTVRGEFRGGCKLVRELGILLCGESDKRDQRAQDDNGLKTERDDDDPFQ
jgi:hypothetical protein